MYIPKPIIFFSPEYTEYTQGSRMDQNVKAISEYFIPQHVLFWYPLTKKRHWNIRESGIHFKIQGFKLCL